jgi:hypothetical protein
MSSGGSSGSGLAVRRAYKEQEARAGASGQVFASMSPQTRRLFGLDE